jgi:hypothetical protein
MFILILVLVLVLVGMIQTHLIGSIGNPIFLTSPSDAQRLF